MRNIDCNVIRDLLPLYIDNVCSKESAQLVKEHLSACDKCRSVHASMTTDVSEIQQAPGIPENKLFRHAFKTIIGIIIALAVMISCLVLNVGGAWMGGPAPIGNLIATILYCVFWTVFTVVSRDIKVLAKVSFFISLFTLVSSSVGFGFRLFHAGDFIIAFISVFSSVPMYGLRFFMDWTGLYAVSTVLSVLWVIYTAMNLRRIKQFLKANQ